jgi:hypothetical protein
MTKHTRLRMLVLLAGVATWQVAMLGLAQDLKVPKEEDANLPVPAANNAEISEAQQDKEWLTAYMLTHQGYRLEHLDALNDVFGKMTPSQLHAMRLMYQEKYESSKRTDALMQRAQEQSASIGELQVKKEQTALKQINSGDTGSANLEDQRLTQMHREASENYQQEQAEKSPVGGYPGYYGTPYAPRVPGYGGYYRP